MGKQGADVSFLRVGPTASAGSDAVTLEASPKAGLSLLVKRFPRLWMATSSARIDTGILSLF